MLGVVIAHQMWAKRQRRLRRERQRASDGGGAAARLGPPLPRGVPEPPRLNEPTLPLTTATCALVDDSMPLVACAEAARIFYDELFKLEPELRAMFGCVMSQQKKLVGMLRWVGASIHDASKLAEGLRALGTRHVKYGARLCHFRAIRMAFLRMVQVVDQQTLSARRESRDEWYSPEAPAVADKAQPVQVVDRHARMLDVSRAWEALLYAFIAEMGPAMLMAEDIAAFHRALANDLAAPAGGTCLALSGAQGAALLLMSAELTRLPMPGSIERALVDGARAQLTDAIGALEKLAALDMAAYCLLMAAVRQPVLAASAERTDKIARALRDAASVPLQVAEWATHALRIARSLLPLAASSGVGDAGAGVFLLVACARTAVQNCTINTRMRLAQGRPWRTALESRALELKREVAVLDAELNMVVEERIGGS